VPEDGSIGIFMNEAIIKYYRQLLTKDFPNAGELDYPFVFMEAIGQKMIDCGNTGNYMQLYFRVVNEHITVIKYLCSCEPVANVAVEVLCSLVKGMSLKEAAALTEEPFFQLLVTRDDDFRKKVNGLLEILREGIQNYYQESTHNSDQAID
jgi:NifU-like protein involved in Fe-S cluster formation